MNHQELEQLREDAIVKLIGKGIWVAQTATMTAIVPLVEKATGRPKGARQRVSDYLAIWMNEDKPRVLPPYQRAFRPIRAQPHPRLADIQRAQPPVITPKGIGNFKQPGGFMPEVWR